MNELSLTTPLITSLERGNQEFYIVFRAFMRPFTQTKLINLSEQHLGVRAFHSSQMSGLTNGTLKDPAPKLFLALGCLNTALARSIGHPEELIEQHPTLRHNRTLPGTLRRHWEHSTPMLDAEGIAMGPIGLFEAFCGLRDLCVPTAHVLAPTEEYAAATALGAYLRAYYGRHTIDWYSQLDAITATCPILRPLLLNEPVSGEEITLRLEDIAKAAETTSNTLWEHIQSTLGR
jgi:hypothetical protein